MAKTLYGRVVEEMKKFDSAEEASLDHLNMAHAHMHEEFEGRDVDSILTDLEKVISKIKKYKTN